MATSHTEYLGLNLMSEGQMVTYRSLSRALKVHNNLTKQMLYEFQQTQNKKKPGSVHVTYLLTGRQRVLPKPTHTDAIQNGGEQDTDMHSSPLPASSAPRQQENEQESHSWIKLITLAKEEQLDDAKANFDELLSIHVYSLEPGTINDLEVLTECNRKIAADFATEDPLEVWKQYGTIQNANVKRRTTRRPPPPVAVPAARPKSTVKQEAPTVTTKTTKATEEPTKPAAKPEAATTDATTEKEQKPPTLSRKSSAAKPPTVKRDVSNIFKSFAKAKPKIQKPAAETSAEPSPSQTPAEDESMGGLSDEEAGDEDTAMFDEGALGAPSGKGKKEREEELRLMMEADDEPMEDVVPSESANSAPSTAPVADEEESQTKQEPEPSESVTVSDGRRRGKRRVMKKKTVKDEEGYLVTREEAAWESFSEDEPVPKKTKVSAPVSAPAKGKKSTAAKAGQGNIMSFFKKA